MNDNTISDANLYFTFLLGDVVYAVDVRSVKEVLTYEPITRVPRTADYLKGVMNIRGTVISVLDFRNLFGIASPEADKSTSIIVTEVESIGEPSLSFGFIADAVEGVSELDSVIGKDQINTGMSDENYRFVKKLARSGERFVLILDMQTILEHVEADLEKLAKTK